MQTVHGLVFKLYQRGDSIMIREQSETVIEALLITAVIAVMLEVGWSIVTQIRNKK